MRTFQISSLEEYLAQPMMDLNRQVYRGVANAAFRLIPSIGRFEGVASDALFNFERHIFQEFKRRAHPHLKKVPTSDFEWLFLAQHYRLPTRLLDWTTNPLVAIYFASLGEADTDFAVYRTLHLRWLAPGAHTDPFVIPDVSAVHPPHIDQRHVAQDGVFTVHPDPRLDYVPLNLDRLVFPAAVREETQWKLRRLGFSAARMFPGLEGLAIDLVQEADFHLNQGVVRTSSFGAAGDA
jgi:hypothetical protein